MELLFFAISATQSKIAATAKETWKYQKYTIVLEFEQRLRLPPPFTVISYVGMFLSFIVKLLMRCCKRCLKHDKPVSIFITNNSLVNEDIFGDLYLRWLLWKLTFESISMKSLKIIQQFINQLGQKNFFQAYFI